MFMPTSTREENDSDPMSLDSSPANNDDPRTPIQHSEITSSQIGAINFYSIQKIRIL